jgi:transcriptional regulator with XRE-family HTH domain
VPRQLPLPDHWRELGEFIREQRNTARLSLRRLSELAGISNPYLSQIERGLRKPSAEILQQIAKALRISAETLYVQAGILEPTGGDDVQRAVLGDHQLSEEQKQALLRIYLSFRHEQDAQQAQDLQDPDGQASPGGPEARVPASDRPEASTRLGGASK